MTLEFKAHYDSEAGYDPTFVEYLSKSGIWNEILMMEGRGDIVANETIPADSIDGAIKVRFRFCSDGAWSDEDGLHTTDGAIIIDSLVVSDETGVLDNQDFETEAVGDISTADGDWWASTTPGYGDFSGVFSGLGVLQEDACERNITGLWGFFKGSEYDMSCAGHPEQAAVPYGREIDGEMKYLTNEIWSPLIDWNTDMYGNPVPGTASHAYFEFDMYADNPLSPLVAMIWHVRSWKNGCPGVWRDRAWVDFFSGKYWMHRKDAYGDLVDQGAEQIQLAFGCYDVCDLLCGSYGNGECHRHAPLYDNVRFLRLNFSGPQWSIRDIRLFQDNFASNGTVTGTVRIDMANDLLSASYSNIRPGDSTVVLVEELNRGLDYHVSGAPSSGPAVYIHVKDVDVTKSGAAISGDLSRWPVAAAGGGWTVLRLDTVFTASGAFPGAFCVDLNDDLFTPGDTILYYFSARDANGATTYAHKVASFYDPAVPGVTNSEAVAQADPFEMTCLPANALAGVTDILYVDDFDRRGAQEYFDQAFAVLGITPDRYDVLGPALVEGNGPGARVVDAAAQILPYYKKIIWNSGNLGKGTIGDGVTNEKSNDFGLLYTFLDQHTGDPGLYISGDDVASEWVTLTGADAVDLRAGYMGFNLVNANHVAAGEPLSPYVMGIAGACFDHDAGPDTLIAYGGCPAVADFDVLDPTGAALMGMFYSNNPSRAAAVVQATTNSVGATARVVLEGFSFDRMRDDRVVFPPDEMHHLLDILRWFENIIDDPTGGGNTPEFENSLSQNYPNPFNPTTTILYSIREKGRVGLKIYNVAGQLVRTLEDSVKDPNVYSRVWNGLNDGGEPVASGVYFCRLAAKDFTMTKKMVVVR